LDAVARPIETHERTGIQQQDDRYTRRYRQHAYGINADCLHRAAHRVGDKRKNGMDPEDTGVFALKCECGLHQDWGEIAKSA